MAGALRIGLALAFAALALPAAATDLKRAQEIVEGRCFLCHGVEGESASPLFPRLAGQNAAYIARQLADYANGRRKSSTMQPMVEGLSEADFLALGHWYESRPTHTHPVEDAALAEQGRRVYELGNAATEVPACASCHGAQAHGSATLPRLAGQHVPYIERQLRLFRQRERSNDGAVMHAVASRLSEGEARAVASYLGGLR
jgi:cytochrome c553